MFSQFLPVSSFFPVLPFLVLGGIPCFFLPLRGFRFFFECFSLIFQGFGRGTNPCFFGGFPCRFLKNEERKDRAFSGLLQFST